MPPRVIPSPTDFLSNLGMLTALSGNPNWVSAVLFFYLPHCSWNLPGDLLHPLSTLFPSHSLQKMLCLIGSIFGVLAGISFIGIAFAPADIARPAHVQFVMWAFRLFPLAVLCYVPVMFMDKRLPQGVCLGLCYLLPDAHRLLPAHHQRTRLQLS